MKLELDKQIQKLSNTKPKHFGGIDVIQIVLWTVIFLCWERILK